jgi:hypothetical protein
MAVQIEKEIMNHDQPTSGDLKRETFILRLWCSVRGPFAWRGHIQDVRTWQIVAIKSPEEIINYIKAQMGQLTEETSERRGLK